MMAKTARAQIERPVLYIIVSSLAVLFVFPFFWTVGSSLKQASELFLYPPSWVPAKPQWHNYARVFEVVPFALWLRNTIALVILRTTGTLISATLVAYSFARFQYPGRDVIFLMTLGTMMLPSQVTLIPQFVLFFKLHWVNTFKPLWVPSWLGGGAFFIFLLRQFIATLPMELDEAALIDGAGYVHIFWAIVLPLCKPALATVSVISFISSWNDFMGPLIYLNSPEKFTVALGLRFFNLGGALVDPGEPLGHILMAACVIALMPCVVIFFLVQRFFVRGIVLSGIKG